MNFENEVIMSEAYLLEPTDSAQETLDRVLAAFRSARTDRALYLAIKDAIASPESEETKEAMVMILLEEALQDEF